MEIPIIESSQQRMEKEKTECLKLCDTISTRSRQFKSTVVAATLNDLIKKGELDDEYGNVVLTALIDLIKFHPIAVPIIQALHKYYATENEPQPENVQAESRNNP